PDAVAQSFCRREDGTGTTFPCRPDASDDQRVRVGAASGYQRHTRGPRAQSPRRADTPMKYLLPFVTVVACAACLTRYDAHAQTQIKGVAVQPSETQVLLKRIAALEMRVQNLEQTQIRILKTLNAPDAPDPDDDSKSSKSSGHGKNDKGDSGSSEDG